MIVVLTICSVNYLAQAKTLGLSVMEHNPGCQFVIGLVDKATPDLLQELSPLEVIPVENLGIAGFDDMVERYMIVELNTAVKPFYMEHLYGRNPAVEAVIYLDPDILVFQGLTEVVDNLKRYNIVLTPHCCTYDENDPVYGYEESMLKTGIYNLGFIGTSRTPETMAFLNWWKRRLAKYCYYRPGSGLFVDQSWAMLASLYFANVFVEKGLGYNMCYWNLPERTLQTIEGRLLVNGQQPLIFYHFSSHDPNRPDYISNRKPPVLLSSHPELDSLFKDYDQRLMANGYMKYSPLRCHYYPPPPPPPPPPPEPPLTARMAAKRWGQRALQGGLKSMPRFAQGYLRRVARFVIDKTE